MMRLKESTSAVKTSSNLQLSEGCWFYMLKSLIFLCPRYLSNINRNLSRNFFCFTMSITSLSQVLRRCQPIVIAVSIYLFDANILKHSIAISPTKYWLQKIFSNNYISSLSLSVVHSPLQDCILNASRYILISSLSPC